MSYDLQIRRPGRPITLEEFRAFVAADAELELDHFVDAHGYTEGLLPDGQTLRIITQGKAGWPNLQAPRAYFHFSNGTITVRSPSDAAIDKMRKVASALGAIVVGDAGERY